MHDPINDVRTKIDQTPDAGIPALQAAYDRIKQKRDTQLRVLADTNELLTAAGLPALTQSAFNRWVLRIRSGRVKRPTLSQGVADPANATNVASEVARLLRALADQVELKATILGS